jgi:hypothetical protein
MFRELLVFVLLISGAACQMPEPGDEVRVSVLGGLTYYGTVSGLNEGLLSIVCNGTSTEKPELDPPMRYDALTGWRAGPVFAPSIRPVANVSLCIGTGSIIELAWL